MTLTGKGVLKKVVCDDQKGTQSTPLNDIHSPGLPLSTLTSLSPSLLFPHHHQTQTHSHFSLPACTGHHPQPTMETTQRFRLAEGIAIEEIPCNHVNGQAIIYWDDIELVFPGVKRVKCGNVSVNPLRDLNENR